MKAARVNNQKGFTLIEVSLAIVIGIIVLGGAIVLYNQTKTSSANSAASAKSLALQSVVEELAAANNGTYPTVASLNTAWATRRPTDYNQSPFGGTLTTSIESEVGGWVTQAAAPTAEVASAGVAVYVKGASTIDLWDNNAVATKSFRQYSVGLYDGNGIPAFRNGK